jgi:AsmA protein
MKRIAILTIVIVVVAMAGLSLIRFVTSVDALKSGISRTVAGLTGRAVTFDGQARLTFTPGISITISAPVIAGPGSNGVIMRARSLTAAVRFWPLLLGRAEFDTFHLVKPRFTLARDAEGQANWIMPEGVSPGPATGLDDPEKDVRLGQLQIEDGSIAYIDGRTGKKLELSDVTMRIDWASSSADLEARGSFGWNDETIAFEADIADPLELFVGGKSAIRIAGSAAPVEASFTGTAAHYDAYQLEGDVNLTTPSLRQVLSWVGIPMRGGSVLGPAALSGHGNWVGKALSFSPAEVELDGNSAEGAISLDWHEQLRVHGTLAFDKLDLTPYLVAARAALAEARPEAPASLPVLRVLEVDLRLSAGSVVLGTLEPEQAAATVSINNGVGTITVGQMIVAGGQAGAVIEISQGAGGVTGRAEGTFNGLNMETFLEEIGAVPVLEGTAAGNFDGQLEARSWDGLRATITGSVHTSIEDGAINGFDATAISTEDISLADIGGSTAFEVLSGTVSIGGNRLAAREVVLDTRTRRFSGEASILLETGEMELNALIAGLAQEPPGNTATGVIRLTVTGPWTDPLITTAPAADPTSPDEADQDEVTAPSPPG